MNEDILGKPDKFVADNFPEFPPNERKQFGTEFVTVAFYLKWDLDPYNIALDITTNRMELYIENIIDNEAVYFPTTRKIAVDLINYLARGNDAS